jgi:general secretion pathway protein F/type IV pilus assembly protein PilC
MANYRYIALTSGGERVVGVLAGASEQAVLAELETRRLTPVQVAAHEERSSPFTRRVSTRQLATAYTQLADLLRAGVPLMRGLRLLGSSKSSPRLAAVFTEVADAVAEGTELAEAMAARPEVFARIHIAMVRAGEKGGFLDQVLARLGAFLQNQADLRARVVGSLIYPAVLVFVGVTILGIVFGVFVPKFRPMFATMEEQGGLPALTKAVLGLGEVVSAWGPVLAVGIVVGLVALWRVVRKPEAAKKLDAIKLRMPIIGPLIAAIAIARFCRILGTMLGNSIPMLAAMQIAREAAGNAVLEDAIVKATEAVRQGQPLAPPLAESGLFAPDVVEMITVGEQANNLDDVLVTVAQTLESRIERMLQGALKLIEPLILLLIAVVVGLVAAGLVLPISQMGSAVR